MSAPVCNRDCFRCVYDDCIVDDISPEEEYYLRRIDATLLHGEPLGKPTAEDIKARKRMWYLFNRERARTTQRAYRQRKRQEKRGASCTNFRE